ncbi:FIST C-terminal domain-containing protein [Methanolobus sp. WCC4]|uniref:FIST signal transduction protein n=1 Tax=Methanolobus sp. WCC4 TaxID=3125784 RepID=UPI0030F55E01
MYIPEATVQTIVSTIEGSGIKKNETAFIMLSEHQIPDIETLISELNERNIEFVGGIFPGLLHGSEKHDTGAIIKILPVMQPPILVHDNGRSLKDMEELLKPLRSVCDKSTTAFIIVNGASPKTSSLLSSLFSLFADSIEYIGCGAGFVENRPEPIIFTPDGFFEDAAVITLLNMHCDLGVHHGWEKAIGPLVVTKSEGNVVKELNWRNAFEVYKKAVESHGKIEIKDDNFLEISAHHPLGIYLEDHEDLLRVVVQTNDEGHLICAGDMPENAVLNIMKGDTARFVRSAERVLDDCFTSNQTDHKHCLVIECVGRSIYLQDNFTEELKTIKKRMENRNIRIIPEGVLSVGEIASMGEDILEFFNYTIVAGMFRDSTCTKHTDL